MKNLLYIILFPLLLIATSCSDDSDDSSSNPLSPGGTINTGTVTFTIGSQQGDNGGILFYCTPSVSVKLTKVTCSLPAQSFSDALTDDGTTIYNANEAVGIQEYTGIESGQQWTFQFEGTLVSNNQSFNVTSNYTVP